MNYFASLFAKRKKIIMFLLTVQEEYKFFLFSAIFRMIFSEREPKRNQRLKIKKKNQVYHKKKKLNCVLTPGDEKH